MIAGWRSELSHLAHNQKTVGLNPTPATKRKGFEMSVHSRHCCVIHGCKYGDEHCPVVIGSEIQEYPCEMCDDVKDQYHRVMNNVAVFKWFDGELKCVVTENIKAVKNV